MLLPLVTEIVVPYLVTTRPLVVNAPTKERRHGTVFEIIEYASHVSCKTRVVTEPMLALSPSKKRTYAIVCAMDKTITLEIVSESRLGLVWVTYPTRNPKPYETARFFELFIWTFDTSRIGVMISGSSLMMSSTHTAIHRAA